MARTKKAAAGAAAAVRTEESALASAGTAQTKPSLKVVAQSPADGAETADVATRGGADGYAAVGLMETSDRRGLVVDIPLDRLKKSPRNARKQPHSLEAIQALAGSIAAKTMLQPPTVEPELDATGAPTGDFLVTIGEGRRLAMVLLAQRGVVAGDEPVRCIVSTAHDPFEISLDENVTRDDMHPADQFEAFKTLAEAQGWGAEEIAARFGVSANVVRQRLRLGAVSPKLIAHYREEALSLDQLMAFAVSEDHARQEQVYDGLSYNRSPQFIRRAMTEAKVHADDKRAVFVGAEAYLEAGGHVLRDLFTEDDGGWFEDVALLDRLTAEKLAANGEAVKAEGWKWVEALMDFPHAHGLSRLYPHAVPRSAEDVEAHNAMAQEYDDLTEQWADVDDLPPDVEARLAEIDAALQAYGDDVVFDPDDVARAGAFVVLGYDGQLRVERGFLRPEDARALAAEDDPDGEGSEEREHGGDETEDADERASVETEDAEPDGLTPLPDRLVADLTAHRTLALREALAGAPDVALLGVTHALAARTFYPYAGAGACLDVKAASVDLGRHAEGIADTPLARAASERHDRWAAQLPPVEGLWDFIVALDIDSRMSLLAHCVSLTLDAVRAWECRPVALAQADALARMVRLDMTQSWTPTVRSYLGRVTKAQILEAVREGVSTEAAKRMAHMKKPAMAEAAEAALAGRGWLPAVLRTTAPAPEPGATGSASPDTVGGS